MTLGLLRQLCFAGSFLSLAAAYIRWLVLREAKRRGGER